jgi:hypothetical protein
MNCTKEDNLDELYIEPIVLVGPTKKTSYQVGLVEKEVPESSEKPVRRRKVGAR